MMDFCINHPITPVVNAVVQGSTVARQASEKERAKDLPTYKDNDFLSERREICIGPEKRAVLMTTLHADTEVGWNQFVIVVAAVLIKLDAVDMIHIVVFDCTAVGLQCPSDALLATFGY